jgi:hypothetical protein
MGALNPTQRIVDVVQSIEQKLYQLPSIQRPFVWEQRQILRLLDSIMCKYPTGAVMVWKPSEKVRCRAFLERYESGDRVLSELPAPAERAAHMVLDGQQRLQSLFLSFVGRYDGKRVYLRIDGVVAEEEDDLHYGFQFLSDDEAGADPVFAHLGELAKLDVSDIDQFVSERLKDVDQEVRRRAIKVVSTFVSTFAMRQALLFQEVDEKLDYNDVLEVFERVNSGGTPLSKSELLFSTLTLKLPDMEARFTRIVDELNDGGRHDFNTDFVIKTAFVIFGKKAKYDFNKLNDDALLQRLAADFDLLEEVVTSLRVWLDGSALVKSGRFLRSKLALIPIIDYLMMNRRRFGPAEGAESLNMRQYLYMAFFSRLFSRAPDSVLDQLHDILVAEQAAKPGVFPIEELGAFMGRREKKGGYQFRDEYLGDLDLVLNIIDGGVLEIPRKRGWSLERDHIFPQNELRLRSIVEDVHDAGNFRLLGKFRNISKSDTMPDKNTEFFGKDDSSLLQCFETARTDLTQDHFTQFAKQRRALIRSRIMEFLAMKSPVSS